jgi:Ca-activated chloride channel family protein
LYSLPRVVDSTFRPTARPSRQARDELGGAVKRELCVVNRFFILLLLACFFVTHASRLAAQTRFDGSDENKAKDDGAAAAKEGSNPTKEDGAAAAVKDGNAAGAAKDPNAAKDDSKAKEDVKRDTPGSVLKPGQTMHMDVDLALVNVTVTDPYNRLVTGLDTDNFRVFEDNIEQELVTFSSEDVPISIGVIFDFSGSMANKVSKAREAAIQFFKTANPQDEFFLVSFNERAELTSSFTNSIEDLQSRMMLTVPKGRTALLDAIYLGLSQMRGARNAKRALLILSDGGDNHSRYSENDIKRLVKEADTQLYAVGIFDPLGYRNRTPEELNGPSLLGEVTEMTGGRVFAVEKLEELPDIATKIGMELRNQYVIGYRPSNKTHDARWRKVKVKLRAPKGLPPLSVYAKTGYYAPSH